MKEHHIPSHNSKLTAKVLLDTGAKYQLFRKGFKIIASKTKIIKSAQTKVMSANGANLSPIGQCDFTFQLGKKHLMDRFLVHQDL